MKGRERELPFYKLDSGEEYRGHTGWVAEYDPRVRQWLATCIAKIEAERWQPPVETVRHASIANLRWKLSWW